MACISSDIAAAAPGQFDGNYKGMFSFTGAQGWGSGQAYSGFGCDNSQSEQVMSVSGDRVYIDRKSTYAGRTLVLSGTVSADGTVSGSGAENEEGHAGHAIFFTVVGKIENGGFTGQISSRNCSYTVNMKR
jgi:FKBP-type peptidyl-prolyl cis-trans isomerase 2